MLRNSTRVGLSGSTLTYSKLPITIGNVATEIGTRIKRARERKRWSQQRLADALKVNRKTVDNWENGRTEPRSSIGALEDVLGVRLDDTPEEPEEKPTPEELNDLRDHIREVLPPDRAAKMLAALDAEFGNSLKRGETAPSAPTGRPS